MADTLEKTPLVEVEDDENDADFNSGYTMVDETPTAVPLEKTGEEAKETPKVEPEAKVELASGEIAPAAVVVPPAPKYVQITQEELDALKASATRTDGLDKKIKDTITGTLGEVEQRIVNKLKAATPAGEIVALPDDVVSDIKEQFPELAPLLLKSLEKALKLHRGTGTAETPEAGAERWKSMLKDASAQYQREALEAEHPTWRVIVGASATPDPNIPFRKWLLTQPAEYQHKVNETNNAMVLGRAIDKFQAYEAAEAAKPKPPIVPPKDAAFTARAKAAIQPKGDGGRPAPTKTDEDSFNEGFREG